VSKVGVVVIGRNEGERFRRCLASLEASGAPVVYVDSGSSDGSVEWARPMCSAVVALDTAVPFTAARARNAGFEPLLALHPGTEFVQFVDGDCEVDAGWIDRAVHELQAEPRRAVVCGRRRERYPGGSIYNRLCDIEWDTPVGPTGACGGDSMMRVVAFREVGGFDETLLAGEEPELCVRLRQRQWTIFRVDAEMTLHDAAMTRFRQWWRRTLRSGYGYGQGCALHGAPPERLYWRKIRSILISGFLVPVLVVALARPTRGWSLALLAWYPARIARFAGASRRRGLGARDAWIYSAFCMLANLPQFLGLMKYLRSRIARRPSRLIEYKDAP
jgi:GT2 family glycosyltransferase